MARELPADHRQTTEPLLGPPCLPLLPPAFQSEGEGNGCVQNKSQATGYSDSGPRVPGAQWPSPLHRTRDSRPGRAGEIHGAGVAESRPPDTVPTNLGSFLSVSQDFAAQSGCARPSPVCLGSRAGAPLSGTPGAPGGQPYPFPTPGLGLSSQAPKKAGPDENSLLGTVGRSG